MSVTGVKSSAGFTGGKWQCEIMFSCFVSLFKINSIVIYSAGFWVDNTLSK